MAPLEENLVVADATREAGVARDQAGEEVDDLAVQPGLVALELGQPGLERGQAQVIFEQAGDPLGE